MTNAETSLHLFLLLGGIICVCKLVGLVARPLGQAQVIAEMVTGFLLGPSLLGWAAPGVSAWLFRPEAMPIVYALAQIALDALHVHRRPRVRGRRCCGRR